ncbi:MAG: efflux transporter outer membrane subunit [Victivallales bacterium]|nr:efflux transporter outer membrane subunit [Victivallales bacterium]
MKISSITKCLFIALIPMLAGCLFLGPDYKEPQWGGPEKWYGSAPATSPLPDGAQWWTIFNDPILNELEDKLLEQNPTLAAAVARLDAAAAQIGIARSSYAPSLNLSGSAAYDRASGEVRTSTKSPHNPEWLLKPGVSMSWELDFWGRVRRNVEAAKADFEATAQDILDSRRLLSAKLATCYVALRTLQARLDYARKNAELQEKTLEFIHNRHESGLCGELDFRQAEMNLASTRANIPALESKIDSALNSIAILVGGYPGSLEYLRKVAPVPLPDNASLPTTLPADLLRNRPDVAAAAHRIHSAVASIGSAKAEFFPKISINGSFAFAATSNNPLFSRNAQNYSIGPSIEWSIFTAGRLRNQYLAAKAKARAAEEDFRAAVLTAASECESAISSHRAANTALKDLRTSVAATEKAVELVDTQYRSGLTDFQNVLDMQRQLATNQDSLAVGIGTAASALVEVWQSFGAPSSPSKTVDDNK